MTRLFLILVLGLLLLHGGLAVATNVGGVISADATWTTTGSPYIVISNLMVANNATLAIDPGVEVRFQPDTTLEVSLGKLVARGTQAEMVRFTANATGPITDADRWGCIKFSDGSVDATFDAGGNYLDGSILEYATVEYAGVDAGAYKHAIQTYWSAPYISHCLVQNNSLGAIYTYFADEMRLTSNTIQNNQSGDTGNPANKEIVYLAHGENMELFHNSYTSNSPADATLELYMTNGGTITGDRIIDNLGIGLKVSHNASPDILVSADPADPTWISGNDVYNVYNSMSFGGSFNVGGSGNLDARNVWWGTTDMAEIAAGIYDYMDNNGRGIVFSIHM